ncbi:hypothetical protein WJX82_004157 [Trebouxia sp. C0006]
MKRRPYHVNPALQTWEEKNYLKLMSKKIQAARSTVPKTRGKKSLLSDQADATGDTATPTLHRPLEGPSKVFLQPSSSGTVLGWLGHDRALPHEQKILADVPLSSYMSPAKHVSSRSSRYGGPMPTAGLPPMATAVPVTNPTLPPLPDKAPPMPAAVKPITPDSPDIRATHMLSPPMQLSFASTSFGHFSRSQTPSRNPPKQALNQGSLAAVVLSDSHAVHAERRDTGQVPIRQTGENYRPSGISQAGCQRGQGVSAQGFGLPPIPAAHSAGSPPLPKGRVGKGVAHPAPKTPGVSSTRGKHSLKSKGSRPPNIVPTGARSKQTSSVGSAASASRAHKPPAIPRKHQACRPLAAHEPSDQCVGTVSMDDDWECSLQSEQIGYRSVHGRNLDSAQSPLRPVKGERGGSIGFCGQAQLDKASFTGAKGATIKAGQLPSSSSQLLPPLLDALVLDQATYMAAPRTSSAASFLMHTSSFSPLRDSQLESSSPSHPLFAHTSGQTSLGSIGQNPWAERKALLTDAEALNAEAGQQQEDRHKAAQLQRPRGNPVSSEQHRPGLSCSSRAAAARVRLA